MGGPAGVLVPGGVVAGGVLVVALGGATVVVVVVDVVGGVVVVVVWAATVVGTDVVVAGSDVVGCVGCVVGGLAGSVGGGVSARAGTAHASAAAAITVAAATTPTGRRVAGEHKFMVDDGRNRRHVIGAPGPGDKRSFAPHTGRGPGRQLAGIVGPDACRRASCGAHRGARRSGSTGRPGDARHARHASCTRSFGRAAAGRPRS